MSQHKFNDHGCGCGWCHDCGSHKDDVRAHPADQSIDERARELPPTESPTAEDSQKLNQWMKEYPHESSSFWSVQLVLMCRERQLLNALADLTQLRRNAKDQAETIQTLRGELEQAINELAKLKAKLADPQVVHLNILTGTIALTKEQAIHIAGLPADVEKQMEQAIAQRDVARKALSGVVNLFKEPTLFYIRKLGKPLTNGDQEAIDKVFIAADEALPTLADEIQEKRDDDVVR